MPSSSLLQGIRRRAKVWASNITKEAHKNLGKYRTLINVKSQVEEKDGRVGILSTASGKNKPVARAYEYGSGEHSRLSKTSKWQQGPKGKILITPKRKKVLAFFWDKVDEDTPRGAKFRGISGKTGKALFRFVEHPGVEAANQGRGYLAPAINKVRKQIRAEVPKEVREQVLAEVRRAFKKK